MRTGILTVWLLLPVGFGAYHLGPGQEGLRLDDAGDHLARGLLRLLGHHLVQRE